jgi:hypothetical protein
VGNDPAMSRTHVLVATAALLTIAGCASSETPTLATPAAASIAVTLTPASTTLDACQSVPFQGAVTGTVDQRIIWTVKEGLAGGTIDAGGVYTAPQAPGTYHVLATSAADSTRSIEGVVTVGPEKLVSVAVTPAAVSVAANGSIPFSATVTTSCGVFAAN